VAKWHELIGEPTVADAICDRIVHTAERIELKGESAEALRAANTEEGGGGPVTTTSLFKQLRHAVLLRSPHSLGLPMPPSWFVAGSPSHRAKGAAWCLDTPPAGEPAGRGHSLALPTWRIIREDHSPPASNAAVRIGAPRGLPTIAARLVFNDRRRTHVDNPNGGRRHPDERRCVLTE